MGKMPKLNTEKVARRKRKIEDAALVLFKRRGFHGVGLREIAVRARVSLGNLYNYYRSKEEIYESLLARLAAEFASPQSTMAAFMLSTRFPDDIEAFGRAIGRMVEEHADFLTLIYVDIAAFGGKHVRWHYAGLAERFRVVLAPRIAELEAEGRSSGKLDLAVAFTAVYMQFFNYFVVERMIGAERHMGLSDPRALRALAQLFRDGLDRLFAAHGREGRTA